MKMHYMRCYPVHKVKQGKMEKFLHWQEILCVTCGNEEQTILSRKMIFFFQGDRTVFKLDAWSKHIVSACEAFLRVAEQTRSDSLAVSQRYNEQEYSLSLYTHTLYNLSQQHAKANTKLPAIFQRDSQSSQILSILPPGTNLCFH